MSRTTHSWPRRRTLVLSLAAVAIAAAVAVPLAISSSGAKTAHVVRTAHNAKLGATILVDRRGRTLYHLSVERNGRFVCTTSACLALWRPLLVARGVKPTGAPRLGTVARPGGGVQVTQRGLPLYTFTGDRKPGDVKGDGFKDVGVWRVAVASRTPAPPPPTTTRSSYPY